MANGSGSQSGDDAAQCGVTLPYARAFVVQFTSETDARLEHAEGRVEHMRSGRRVRFASAVDLLACIDRLLADDRGEQARQDIGEKRMRDRISLHVPA